MQVDEGVEGLVHISEITTERRLNHPQDALKVGQVVKALVLAVDTEKRQLKLSIKQTEPTSLDDFLAEQKVGDTVSGRVLESDNNTARIELGEGVIGTCHLDAASSEAAPAAETSKKADLSSLSSMLNAKWKGTAPQSSAQKSQLTQGQILTFKITNIDQANKKIDLKLI